MIFNDKKESINVSRTVGVEMEGFVQCSPYDLVLPFAEAGDDGSLKHPSWEENEGCTCWDDDCSCYSSDDDDTPYSTEIRTEPLTNLAHLSTIIEVLQQNGWEVNDSAGTHVHVDISDYKAVDIAKLLRFGKGIERIIFMFIEPYRYGNTYCKKLNNEWRKVFRKEHSDIDWETIEQNGASSLRQIHNKLKNEKYNWINIFDSYYSTAEFRLFHAVRSADEVIKQAQLAYAIVELVKKCTPKQIDFIIKELYASASIDELIEKFFTVLGLDFTLDIKNDTAYTYLKNKLEGIEEQTTEEVEEDLVAV